MKEENKCIISWDECFMEIAKTVSKRSKDPSTKTGAIIVDENHQVVGLGYNGWIKGANDTDFPWKREGDFVETKYAYVVHCEENAIYCSTKSAKGGTLNTTLFPCNECAKSIIQTGIKEVVYMEDKYHDKPEWKAARLLLEISGTKVRQYE